MTFFTFIIAVIIAFIFNSLLNQFKPQIKAFGLRWTYHAQAFFEVHFWQIEDIKRRDRQKKGFKVPKQEFKNVVILRSEVEGDSTSWNVVVKNIELLEYETIKIEQQKHLRIEN